MLTSAQSSKSLPKNQPETRSEKCLAMTIKSIKKNGFQTHLIDWLQSAISYDNMAVIAYFQDKPPLLLMSKNDHPKVHENVEKLYLTGAYLLDPFHDLHVKNAPDGLYRLSDIAPDKFNRNKYFIEYYKETTTVDEIAFVCHPATGVSLHICLGKDTSSNLRFTNKQINIAKRIEPVVTALAEMHWNQLSSSGAYLENEITTKLIASVKDNLRVRLSPRQAEVAMLVLRGHSSTSIAYRLEISTGTVKVFRKQLYKKCNISSQAELFNLLLPLLGN